MADTKKKTGRYGEYQSGWSLPGAIRKRLPSDDWWSVESTMPETPRMIVSLIDQLRTRFQPSHSRIAGETSRKRTLRYSITHHPTSNITDVTPKLPMIGLGSRHGRPRSKHKPTTTRKYPRKPVRMAERTMGA